MIVEGVHENMKNLQVAIYESGSAVMNVESGTTLKVLKLLYNTQRSNHAQILGVRPRNYTDGIPCIITLDDTSLNGSAYDILVTERRRSEQQDGESMSRCMECSKEAWKTKTFTSTGMNTELYYDEKKKIRDENMNELYAKQETRNEHYHQRYELPRREYELKKHEDYRLPMYLNDKAEKPRTPSPPYDPRHTAFRHHQVHYNRFSSSHVMSERMKWQRTRKPSPNGYHHHVLEHAHHYPWRSAYHYHQVDQDKKSQEMKTEENIDGKYPTFHDATFLPSHPPEVPPVYVLPNDFSGVPENKHSKEEDDKTDDEKFNHVKIEQSQSPASEDMRQSEGVISPDSSTHISKGLLCKICNEVFATKSLLYKHLRGHSSDEKPFKCSECGQGFTLSSNLRQHRIIHRGYKPFQCEFCGKKFMRSNVYKQHRRIHTGEQMHKCGLCPSEFLQKYALIKHMKKNHDIEAMEN